MPYIYKIYFYISLLFFIYVLFLHLLPNHGRLENKQFPCLFMKCFFITTRHILQHLWIVQVMHCVICGTMCNEYCPKCALMFTNIVVKLRPRLLSLSHVNRKEKQKRLRVWHYRCMREDEESCQHIASC